MAASSRSRLWPFLFGLLFLALIAQSVLLYPRLKNRDAEIATLREAIAVKDRGEVERDAPGQLIAQSDELARLRKDNQELHRLRNEVRQLREASQQAGQATKATPAAPASGATELVGQLQRQVQQLQMENTQLRAAQQLAVQVQDRAQALNHVCINNLRQLDGAKEQWALENRQPVGAVPEPADIEPYLRDPALLLCASGGQYTLHAIGTPPTCSVPGHNLP